MNVTTLKLEGRLDTAEVGRIEAGFAAKAGSLRNRGDRAILDIQDVTYLSSMGIRILVQVLKQFQQRGIAFVTLRPKEKLVNDTLDIASLTDHLNMVQDLEEAHAIFNRV